MRINLPSLFTTYRPRKPVAPNTVAAIPLEDERPPFPLGMMAWCSFLCWTVVTESADSPAGTPLPVRSAEPNAAFSHHFFDTISHTHNFIYLFSIFAWTIGNNTPPKKRIVQNERHMSATASKSPLEQQTDTGWQLLWAPRSRLHIASPVNISMASSSIVVKTKEHTTWTSHVLK